MVVRSEHMGAVMGVALAGSLGRRGMKPVAIVVTAALALGACQTTSGGAGGGGEWQIDAVAQRCIASVIGGAFIGALAGAASGGGRAIGTGAAIGAGAGGALCAVMAALDAQDRARIREAQLQAATTGSIQSQTYVGADGRQRRILVRPQPVDASIVTPTTLPNGSPSASKAAAEKGERVCRRLDTTTDVATVGSVDIPVQIVCRSPTGEWQPA